MATYYWYGGTGTWSDYTNHWSFNSGNSPANPASSAPNYTDDVVIDSSSGFGGGGTITATNPYSKNFSSTTGHTYTIDLTGELDIENDVLLEAGLTITGGRIGLYMDAANSTFTTNGATLNCNIWFRSYLTTSVMKFMDNCTIGSTNTMQAYKGVIDANGFNMTAGYFFLDGNPTGITVYMRTGTWTSTGGKWAFASGNTLDAGTSKLIVNFAGDCFFAGKTYYDFETVDDQTLWGGATFNNFTIYTPTSPTSANDFEANKTFTINGTFTANGNATYYCTIKSHTTNTQFTLSKSSGTVSCDYLDLTDSNATGGASWYAGTHSLDTNNNDGWIFTAPPSDNTASFSVKGYFT